MSSAECSVCSVRSNCQSADIYLYAPTEILGTRIGSVLRDNNVPFTEKERTFLLQCGREPQKFVELLRSHLSEPESHDLRITFDLVNLMAATSLDQFALRVETRWFEEALVNDLFTHWFQPIVDVEAGSVFAHECLIRLSERNKSGKLYNGQEIIDAAVTRGDLHVFDSYSRRKAILNGARRHTGGRLFINFTPSSIYDPAFCMKSTEQALRETHLGPSDIVFEVVECERVTNPRHLRKIVDYYRERGFGVALDDVGTGANSLQMITDIQPDFIKLDKSIIWKYDSPIGNRTIRKLAELGNESQIAVIAEGVETEPMRNSLSEAGIRFMQGYFFGKPSPEMTTTAALPVR